MEIILPEGLTTAEIDQLLSRQFRRYDWSGNLKVAALISYLFNISVKVLEVDIPCRQMIFSITETRIEIITVAPV